MKKLFEGKRKLITIPLVGILALAFFPFAIGLGLGWLVYKKVSKPKLKYSLLAVIALFTIFFGSAWVSAVNSPSNTKTNEQAQVTPTPEAQTAAVEVKESTPTATPSPADTRQSAKITRVVDGDTIDVSINGKAETIRFIGINTPETVDPRKPVECFGEKASAVAKENLTGETVLLESDPIQGERDKYNRLLRYVWTDDGTVDFGKVMIATGFAYEYTYNTPYKYQAAYKQAQKEAEQGKKGLWADNACPVATAKPTAKPTTAPPAQQTQQQTTSGGSCKYSCSSPDRDCSDFSSHAEAQAFFDCCGFTATNDPMKLDSVGVGDGVACESI
ncbi:MAG: thermonuclease family protein [Candidatus Daviesbacteria bacterium]|nr:thermonuclease family protein [Candidatus Daviesbacteria bacterium]